MSSSQPSLLVEELRKLIRLVRLSGLGLILLWVLPGLMVLLVFAYGFLTRQPVDDTVPRVGQPLADFTLPDLHGQSVQLAALRGKVVFVNVWATWCPPCVEEVPALSKFWEKYRGRDDLVLYTVSEDKDWKTIDDFSTKNPNTLPVYRDLNSATAQRFGSSQYPETYIVNKNGRVIYRVQGAIEWSDAAIQQRIDQLLNS